MHVTIGNAAIIASAPLLHSALDWREGPTSQGKIPFSVAGRESQTEVPEPELDRAAIQAQLEKILTKPLFKDSRRYPSLSWKRM